VIVDSLEKRTVKTRIAIGDGEDTGKAIAALRSVLRANAVIDNNPAPQIGVHNFTYGGVILGSHFWVPTQHYYQHRYAINGELLKGLREAGVSLRPATGVSAAAPGLTVDDEAPAAPPPVT